MVALWVRALCPPHPVEARVSDGWGGSSGWTHYPRSTNREEASENKESERACRTLELVLGSMQEGVCPGRKAGFGSDS